MSMRCRPIAMLPLIASILVPACLRDSDEPPIALRLTGDCAAEPTFLSLHWSPDGASFTIVPDRPGSLVPRRGALDRRGGHVREGDFILSGEVRNAGDGFEGFALCVATRSSWLIRLDCVTGNNEPLCTGQLDELGVDEFLRQARADGGGDAG